MAPLEARDLMMTAKVTTIPPGGPVKAIARRPAGRGIAAVPVVDDNGGRRWRAAGLGDGDRPGLPPREPLSRPGRPRSSSPFRWWAKALGAQAARGSTTVFPFSFTPPPIGMGLIEPGAFFWAREHGPFNNPEAPHGGSLP